MNDKGLVFVDTNVLVYAFSDGQDPKAARARQCVDDLVMSDRLATSTQVMQELLVTLVKKKGVAMEGALGLIRRLAILPCFRVDVEAIEEAGMLSLGAKISFWDALILTSARRLGAELVCSEDLNQGQRFGALTVWNPFVVQA